MKLLVDGKPLVLGEDTSIRMLLRSPLFEEEQPGSMSKQFDVPVCEENALIFGFSHMPAVRSDRRRDFPAELQLGTFRLVGILQARRSTMEKYTCNLIIPPGNVPSKVWKRKLKQFNFDTVSYRTGLTPIKHFAATIPNLGGSQFGVSVWIKKGNQELFRVDYPGKNNSGGGDYLPIPFWPDVADQFNARVDSQPQPETDPFSNPWTKAVTGFNPVGAVYGIIRLLDPPGDPGPDLTGYRAFAGDTSFTLLAPEDGAYSIEYVVRFPGSPTRVNKIPLVQLERKVFWQWADDGTNANLMETDPRYCLPMMRDDTWYDPEKNKTWNGYINDFQITAGVHIYTQNNDQASARFSLSPAVYLRYGITRACELLGYRVKDRVFSGELAKLFVWVNRSLDEQLPGTDAPYNQNKTTWAIGDYLPDMTMADWINKGLKNIFARVIFYPSRKEAIIVSLRDVLRSVPAADWSDKMVRTRETEAADYSPLQATYTPDSGDENAKREDALFTQEPTDAIVDADVENNWGKWEMPFSPMKMEKKKVTVNTNDPNSPYYSRALLQTKEISTTPVIKQRGISPLFDQSETALSPGRIMFYIPSRNIPNPMAPPRGGDDYPPRLIPTADYETENLSLQLGGEKGIVAKLGKDWLKLISNPTIEKYRLFLDAIALQQIRWEDKYRLNGLNYLIDSIDITFTTQGVQTPAEVAVRRV